MSCAAELVLSFKVEAVVAVLLSDLTGADFSGIKLGAVDFCSCGC